jgi:phosphoglycolate phosphatase
MTLRHIIFDLDGTLIDSAVLTGAIIDAMLAARGVAATADRNVIRAMDAVGGEAMIAAVMGAHTSDPAADLEEFRARHRRIAVPQSLPFPGVVETLTALRAMGIGLAICSNKPQVLCDKILHELGLDHHFAAIIGSGPDRPRKPDPAPALAALAMLGADPRETLYCGDSTVDLVTARAAGIAACLVGWGYGTADALTTAPDVRVVNAMADLITLAHDWPA